MSDLPERAWSPEDDGPLPALPDWAYAPDAVELPVELLDPAEGDPDE